MFVGSALLHRSRDDREPGLVQRTRHSRGLGDDVAALPAVLDRSTHRVRLDLCPAQTVQNRLLRGLDVLTDLDPS